MEAKQRIAEGALVIDVREKSEWDQGHLPMAKHVPLGEVQTRTQEIAAWLGGDRSKPIVVYCARGGRAGQAKAYLQADGFSDVTNGGGYTSLI